MIGPKITSDVQREIADYKTSQLAGLVATGGAFAIKFVQSRWAANYATPGALKISATPAQTWGTATYVTPLAFPLSSALYGRIGLVVPFDPTGWRVFDATNPSGRRAYVRWAQAQPVYADLLLTVHSTQANHILRNQFREDFEIDCVLFRPDQEAEYHTNASQHVWMAVTDWTPHKKIQNDMSVRLNQARFTVLLDEEFQLLHDNLPIKYSARQIENVTQGIMPQGGFHVGGARGNPQLPALIRGYYAQAGYVHIYIAP